MLKVTVLENHRFFAPKKEISYKTCGCTRWFSKPPFPTNCIASRTVFCTQTGNLFCSDRTQTGVRWYKKKFVQALFCRRAFGFKPNAAHGSTRQEGRARKPMSRPRGPPRCRPGRRGAARATAAEGSQEGQGDEDAATCDPQLATRGGREEARGPLRRRSSAEWRRPEGRREAARAATAESSQEGQRDRDEERR